jgi:hypothetical protein
MNERVGPLRFRAAFAVKMKHAVRHMRLPRAIRSTVRAELSPNQTFIGSVWLAAMWLAAAASAEVPRTVDPRSGTPPPAVAPNDPAMERARGRLASDVAGLGSIVYAARSEAGAWDIFACRPDGSKVRNLTHTPEFSEGYPVVSPDGGRILCRRIGRDEAFDNNAHGSQGVPVICDSNGTVLRVLGANGAFPWACWTADGKGVVCLSAEGIDVVDLSTMKRLQRFDRKGCFQQITAGPDGRSLSAVANSLGASWAVARFDLITGEVTGVNVGDSCTPNWFPDGKTLIFSRRPSGQQANGGYGWTQLWAGSSDGKEQRLLCAEDGRHLYGGHVSPDGAFAIFTGNQAEDGDPGARGSRMSVIRPDDAPFILGSCPETRARFPHAIAGPMLALPEGWEPWWTAADLTTENATVASAAPPPPPPGPVVPRAEATAAETTELTARLVEIPPGSIRKDPLYRYAAVLKYEVVRVHHGPQVGKTLYVAHYRPQFSRATAADRFMGDVSGALLAFRAGDLHRMVLLPDAEKHFVGGVINHYLEAESIFWATRTDDASVPAGK